MAGHSKWATTKRHKAAVDAKRGKLFSIISKELTLAARASGTRDPEFSPRIRTLLAKAKAANMPLDNIDRALKKGTGELPGQIIEELTYEGYAPGGIGLIVEVTTDNKNRSASDVRSTFTKAGGNLAGAGALSYNFQRKGQILIAADQSDEDSLMELALDAGADDVINNKDHFEIRCAIADYDALANALTEKGIDAASSDIVYIPNNTVAISDQATADKVLRLIEKLEDLEDVKNVFANYEIDDALLSKDA